MQVVRGSELNFEAASHEDPNKPGVLKKVLATKHNLICGQVQMVNWAKLPVGSSFQPHYHEDMQEVFIMMNGRVEMLVNDTSATLERGDAILIEPREVHQMTNLCEEEVHYVVFGISTEQNGKTVVVDSTS